MEWFHLEDTWLQKLLPDGIAVPSTTVITGPGGAGKPLVGAMLVNSWLKQGGTLVHLLINFDRGYSEKLLRHFKLDVDKYSDKIVYVEFDPELDGIERHAKNLIKANLLKADTFEAAIRQAETLLPASEAQPLIYGSALNMLLFSPSYGLSIYQKIKELLQARNNYLFTIANNIFEDQAASWENTADNLFVSRVKGIMKLGFKVVKMRSGAFNTSETTIPLSEEELRAIRAAADAARKNLIPVLRKI